MPSTSFPNNQAVINYSTYLPCSSLVFCPSHCDIRQDVSSSLYLCNIKEDIANSKADPKMYERVSTEVDEVPKKLPLEGVTKSELYFVPVCQFKKF